MPPGDISKDKKRSFLSEKFLKFGSQAIIIPKTRIPDFKNRLEKAIEEDNYIIEYNTKKVDYVESTYSGGWGIFRKYDSYSWQYEWRLALKQYLFPEKAYPFHIGNLEDIATVVDTVDLIKTPIVL